MRLYSVGLSYMTSYMIVLFTKFSKFPKTSYMIVQNFPPPSAAFFQYIFLFLAVIMLSEICCTFLARRRRDFYRFRWRTNRFSLIKSALSYRKAQIFACGALFFLSYEGGSWDKFLRGGSGFPPCTQLGRSILGPFWHVRKPPKRWF